MGRLDGPINTSKNYKLTAYYIDKLFTKRLDFGMPYKRLILNNKNNPDFINYFMKTKI
ncbi:hypothetical protein KL86DYS1_11960 [uncultured Dysgonomonas sp.]|uniref:Uncharacterized protein n=1 Tax=uncultured Dysgonomonas sp. TaxID=206096 RepID=A0A212JDY6_9BACT|nr:hypothetical protein KL86DYS1_11960 [uncultured Dysgonomonas sp.]